MRRIHRSVALTFVALLTLALPTAGLTDPADDCGAEPQDSAELRAQAATRLSWRDSRAANPESWIRFKLLGFNDFHGQLEGRSLAGRPVGGAAVLAAYLKAESTESANGALIIHAGDHVGATPPASALLQDEPSIRFLNLLANEHCRQDRPDHPLCNVVGTLGNHEFDEGVSELRRLLRGGNHASGPFLQDPYPGVRVPYVSANVVDAATGAPILPPYVIKRVRGEPVAVIGAVLKETPTIVTPAGVAGVRFLDEADAINRYIPELKRQNVRAIVVTIHQGARQNSYNGPTLPAVAAPPGATADIVRRLDDEVDVVISGHAHGFTNALLPNANGKQILLTQAFSAGTAYADIDLAIDPASRDVVEKSAAVITTWADAGPGLQPDPAVTQLVAGAVERVAPLVTRVIGTAATSITRAETPAGESALGNLIADAQRASVGADVAFMNPGGIRDDVAADQVTWGELFAVQPFGNDVIALTLTGAQVRQVLEQQWQQTPARILKTSGLRYTWDAARPVGTRVVEILDDDGALLDPAATYRVAANSFIAGGGDNFSVFTQGTERVVGPVDLEALVTYIRGLPQPFSAAVEGRIQRVN